ncbi:hypothetical protein PSTG_14204 [Puccinia striiformis f. sp. tritici PST-78]|uniref:U-box domain-containing protein n=1 Tax=Puccinia striiformis f. sp. tritici PST-78 TaxID=1165861 RepID=A0A0L0UZ95_9BASI|nr:hypothetical protein PSTG_14204 [Puccinia striiformis f. sp. tritici PST-78]
MAWPQSLCFEFLILFCLNVVISSPPHLPEATLARSHFVASGEYSSDSLGGHDWVRSEQSFDSSANGIELPFLLDFQERYPLACTPHEGVLLDEATIERYVSNYLDEQSTGSLPAELSDSGCDNTSENQAVSQNMDQHTKRVNEAEPLRGKRPREDGTREVQEQNQRTGKSRLCDLNQEKLTQDISRTARYEGDFLNASETVHSSLARNDFAEKNNDAAENITKEIKERTLQWKETARHGSKTYSTKQAPQAVPVVITKLQPVHKFYHRHRASIALNLRHSGHRVTLGEVAEKAANLLMEIFACLHMATLYGLDKNILGSEGTARTDLRKWLLIMLFGKKGKIIPLMGTAEIEYPLENPEKLFSPAQVYLAQFLILTNKTKFLPGDSAAKLIKYRFQELVEKTNDTEAKKKLNLGSNIPNNRQSIGSTQGYIKAMICLNFDHP